MGLPCWQPYYFDNLLEKSMEKSLESAYELLFSVKSH